MLRLPETDGRFVGLKPSVVYRIELGFALVDDGERLFRISRSAFEDVVREAQVDGPDAEGLYDLVRAHPTLFELFEDPDAARTTLVGREL